MTDEEKNEVCDDINDLIVTARSVYKNMESLAHIEGALADRKIEIMRGDWDD